MFLRERAHRTPGFRVFESVQEHRVFDVAVTHAQPMARLREQVRCVRHTFHAAAHEHARAAGADEVDAEHRRLHAGTADFVHSGRATRVGQSRKASGLARRRLLDASTDDVADDDLVDVGDIDTGALCRRANCVCTKRGRSE